MITIRFLMENFHEKWRELGLSRRFFPTKTFSYNWVIRKRARNSWKLGNTSHFAEKHSIQLVLRRPWWVIVLLLVSGVRHLSLRNFVGAQVDEHSTVPQAHCAGGGLACLIQGPRTQHCRGGTIAGALLLYLQSDQRSAEQLWVSWTSLFQVSTFINSCFLFRRILPVDSPFSHILSASCAGFVSSTATNPIWFVKTRLQLDHESNSKMNVRQAIKRIYETNGLRGFYKGITASYFGISETVVHFVIYEALKKKLVSSSDITFNI